MAIYLQGDICFIPIPEKALEDDHKVVEDGVVARGEATGHTHQVVGALVYMNAAIMYIKAQKEFEVRHEEHGFLQLPAGDFVVRRQQEWQPDGWRQVAD